MPSAGTHLPTDMLLAGARSADNFHAQAPLGRALGCPAEVRTKVVGQFPRVNFKQEIAEAFFHGFEHKPQTTECNEDICSHFIGNYKRRNFYDQVQNSPFWNS